MWWRYIDYFDLEALNTLLEYNKEDELNLKVLREKTGYVTQEDIIFNATIRDNISLWDAGADEELLERVIKMAHIKSFVEGIPKKTDALIGENGLNISGGQRQRITIARELYKDVDMLILDEATSSLDSKSERCVYENLRQFKGNKTTIVIAHRLSTIKNADYIIVVSAEKKGIVEQGNHDELIAVDGKYKRLLEMQRRDVEIGN